MDSLQELSKYCFRIFLKVVEENYFSSTNEEQSLKIEKRMYPKIYSSRCKNQFIFCLSNFHPTRCHVNKKIHFIFTNTNPGNYLSMLWMPLMSSIEYSNRASNCIFKTKFNGDHSIELWFLN